MNTETEIQSAIEALREQFPETKALYREACALLFFRHGITPTASKLYQYVRKGSMSAPTEALAKFWEELRDKARVEIDRPDLPDEVKAVAADAIQALWSHATERARQELAASRIEQQAEVQRAQEAEQATLRQVDASAATIAGLQTQLATAGEQIRQLQTELEAERRAHVATAAKGQELQRQAVGLQEQITAARGDFSADLAKAREAVNTANARADAGERRALLEIDQERQARAKADKQAEALRSQLAQVEARQRALAVEHAGVVADLKGKLDGVQEALRQLGEHHQALNEKATTLQQQLGVAQQEALQHRTEATTLRGLIERVAPAAPASAEAGQSTTRATRRPKPASR